MYDELIKRLHRYSKNLVDYKIDADFADAVQQAADAIEQLSADLPPYLDYPKPRKPKTNADRLRAMKDEELAEWLEAHCYQYGWLDWLKEDAKP